MRIEQEKFEENNKALKEAIDGKIKVGKNDVKGHVFCDLYHLHNTKIDGLGNAELKSEKQLVEAAYALRMNESYKTTHKVYLISA